MFFTSDKIFDHLKKTLESCTSHEELLKKKHSLVVFLNWLKSKSLINEVHYEAALKIMEKFQLNLVPEVKKVHKVDHQNITEVIKRTVVKNSLPFAKKTLAFVAFILVLNICIYYMMFKLTGSSGGTKQVQAQEKGRVLTYRGKLSTPEGKPVDYKTDITFRIYDKQSGGNSLYTGLCVGENAIEPEYNGVFSVVIGSDCGMQEISNEIFASHKDLFLGITVGNTEELTPRQNISKVSFAVNAEKLNGVTLGTQNSNIPYIDEKGSLLIDAASPVIESTSGVFTLKGQSMNFETTGTEKSDIIFNPSFGGSTIIANGNFGIGIMDPMSKLAVDGDLSLTGNINLDGLSTNINQLHAGDIYFNTSVAGTDQLHQQMVLKNNGFVGLGTTTPHFNLSVGAQSNNSNIVAFSNFDKTDNQNSSVLRLNVGANSSGNKARFIQFFASSTADNTGTAVGRIRLNNQGVAYETSGADFGEYFSINEDVQDGHIISLSQNGPIKAREGQSLLGVVSGVAGFVGNAKENEDLGNKKIVGLVGQVKTKVSTLHGPIKIGDNITSSKIPGFGAKAIKTGYVVGKALEGTDTVVNDFVPENCPEELRGLTDINGQQVRCGEISLFVSANWYDPGIYVAKTEQSTSVTTSQSQQSIFSQFTSFIAEKATIAVATIDNLTVNSITVVQGKFKTVESEKIISPVIETEEVITKEINTNTINVRNEELEIDLNPQESTEPGKFAELIIRGLEDQVVASVDNQGNATFSGEVIAEEVTTSTLSADLAQVTNLQAQEASVAGQLTAREVRSENINSLEQSVNSLQSSVSGNSELTQQLQTEAKSLHSRLVEIQSTIEKLGENEIPDSSYYQNLLAENNSLSTLSTTSEIQNITVTEKANIYNASITNSITVGKIFIQDDTVVAFSEELKLSALNSISMFNGTIKFAKDGTMETKGKVIADEGKFNKLSLNTHKQAALITPADNFDKRGVSSYAIETENTSAGVGMVAESTNEVIIYNNTITENSLVYLTNTSVFSDINLAVVEKKSCTAQDVPTCVPYFKVTTNKPVSDLMSFNWLIIN